ncbi:MAG TPA: 23S rRNA (pseudouridine(1915)-N(3))-methyltransferase RlmH [Candidatus Binatia bacterium]|nr:23S rRNA (pseudouridine(1915)-N(3))-methyltransferase RlmH [Candidatus Binatia bacterium]
MKIRILAVGKVKERFTQEWIDEFLKRLTKYCRIEIDEIKESTREKEGVELLKRIRDEYVIALDVHGKSASSEAFAQLLKQKTMEKNVLFVIGGPEGWSAEVLKRANESISLSAMTFTHQIARVLLLEQIYRGFTILHGGPYHK